MNQITTVGVDLAKSVIVLCAADAEGHVQFFKQLNFKAFGQWAAILPPCTFGMEACIQRILGSPLGRLRTYRASYGRRVRQAVPQKPRGEE